MSMDKHLSSNQYCLRSEPDISGKEPDKPRNIPVNTCEICGKHLTNRRAYAGHMLLGHGKRVGIMAELDIKLSQAYDMNIAMSRRLDRMEEALAFVAMGQSFDAAREVGQFLRGEMSLNQEGRDLLYRQKK